MWRAGPVVKKQTSNARWAGPDDLLRVLEHVKSRHLRIAIYGVWTYGPAGAPIFDWLGLKIPRSQLAKRLSEVQTDLAGFEAAQYRSLGHPPNRAERREIAGYVRTMQETLMLEMVNDLFADTGSSRPVTCEKAFAWSIAGSKD